MAKKPTRWGSPRDERITQHGDWLVGTREFVFSDAQGGSVFQYKIARNRWAFDDPTACVYGWKSKPSNRHRAEFLSRDEARQAAFREAGLTPEGMEPAATPAP